MTDKNDSYSEEIDMRLAAVEKLNIYEVISPLGAEGMGEVYRARDIKLQRDDDHSIAAP